MFRKYLLPAVAVLGVVFAIYSVVTGQRHVPPALPVTQPAQPQFQSYVAGAGIVEASTENIAVGTLVPGVVTEIFVKIGDQLKAGAPLFRIDDRDLRAELAVRQAALASAQARAKTESASLADTKNQLETWQAVADTRATAHVRGNRDIKTDLTFFRIEPYVVPKRSLTGDSTERVDTRVLQVLYAFDRGSLPIYVGQQMHVFIDAPPVGGGGAGGAGKNVTTAQVSGKGQ